MKKNLLALAVAAALVSGCSAMDAVKTGAGLLADDKGTEVTASAQVGKDASQQVVVGDQNKTETNVEAENAEVSHVRQDKTTQVEGKVDNMTVNNLGDVPVWVILLTIVGWMAPTPTNIWRGLTGLFRSEPKPRIEPTI